MKKRTFKSFIAFLIISISANPFIIAQSTNSGINSDEIIAYCYQPMQGGIHQIFTIDENGNNNTIVINASIGLNHHDWSPDAQMLAAVGYVNQNTWSIYRFNSDGTGLTRLTTTGGVFDSEPIWSPNGNKIAFTRIYHNQNFKNEIWIMDADGSNQTYIGVEGFGAKWSADGFKFIFTNTGDWGPSSLKGSDIMTCNINGTNVRQITNTAGDEWFPSWSPDGETIVFGYSSDGNYASNELFTMDTLTYTREQLTDNNSYDGGARWSPDGTRICYTSDISSYQHWEVYIMNADGSNKLRVTNSASNATAISPVWKPNDNPTLVANGDLAPEQFQLYQNYPNPFNPTTKISFTVPNVESHGHGFLQLIVYDVLGNEIATLIDEEKPVGVHEIVFDGKQLASGMYFFKLQTKSFSETKKMVLLK